MYLRKMQEKAFGPKQSSGEVYRKAIGLANGPKAAQSRLFRGTALTRICLKESIPADRWSRMHRRLEACFRGRAAMEPVFLGPAVSKMMNAKTKAIHARIESLEQAIGRAREYLDSGKHADWSGFRPMFVRKFKDGKELPPHKDWVKNVFLPRMERR